MVDANHLIYMLAEVSDLEQMGLLSLKQARSLNKEICHSLLLDIACQPTQPLLFGPILQPRQWLRQKKMSL